MRVTLLAALVAILVSRATFEVAKSGRVSPACIWAATIAGVLAAIAIVWLA